MSLSIDRLSDIDYSLLVIRFFGKYRVVVLYLFLCYSSFWIASFLAMTIGVQNDNEGIFRRLNMTSRLKLRFLA